MASQPGHPLGSLHMRRLEGICLHVEEAPVSSPGQKGRDGKPGHRRDEKQEVSGFYIQWQSQSLLV